MSAANKKSPQAGELEGLQHNTLQGRSADNFNVREDAEQVARFTALCATRPVAKRYELNDGKLQSKPVHSETYFRNVPVEVACIEDLAVAFSEADAKVIFAGGMSDAAAGAEIRRKKEEMPFRKQPGVMFLDNDVQAGGDQFAKLYAAACPAMASASYVHSPSSSAWILRESDGEVLRGAGGQHYAVPVLDAMDIPRALEALHHRCVLAGLGSIKVSERGVPLERSPVDLAMKTGSQPLFTRVDLGQGLVQAKDAQITAHAGEVFLFDTSLIKSLSAYELTQYRSVIATLKAAKAVESEAVGAQWVAERVQDVAKAQRMDKVAATEYLQKLQKVVIRDKAHTDLVAGIKLVFESGDVDVAEVLANPVKYHDKPCADPLEPSYRGGVGTAKFYAFDASGKPHATPLVSSMAHGVTTIFHLKKDLSHIEVNITAAKAAQYARSAEAGVQVPVEAIEPHGGAVAAAGASEVRAPVARKVFRAGEFMSEMTPKFWILQRVLAKGWLYALAASPGAGKTAVALLLTLRAAMGREFMGRKVTKSKVLYLCGENPQDVRGRFDALLRKHEMTLADVDGQVFFTQSPFNIDDRQDLDAFIADAQQHGPFDLCIIDTQKAHSGAEDENDTSGQHELAQAMRRLGAGIGDPCILTLSHPTKNAGKDNLLPRGGSSFTGSIDGVLCLWREGRGAPSEMFSHRDKFRGKAFEGEFFKMDEVEHPTLLDNFGDADVTVVASELTGQADISGILKAVDNGNTAIVMDKIREACLRGELLSKTAWATELGKKSDYLHVLNGLVTSGQLVGVPCQGALVGKRQGLDVLVPQSVSVDVAFLAAAERQLAAPGIEDEKKEELQRIVQSITERGPK
jgi:hypothetical protein